MSISRFVIFYNSRIQKKRVKSMRLRDLREDNDIPQKAIAAYLHIGQSTYSMYENEKHQIPIDLLIALAKFYGVSVDYLLGLTDVKKPYPKSKRPQI